MIGQVVDGHEIVRSLGVGGMGEVYLARSATGDLRAFKIVRGDRDADPQAEGRFRREVMALGRLDHPNIVRIIDAGRMASGALYLGMEYVAGKDLQSTLDSAGPFSVRDSIRILAQLAAALTYAHAEGIVHRDLKPANVILADNDPGRAKIIDFGLAKIAADEGLTRLTEDQQVLGSPLYWAPEQSVTAAVGSAADVYALGGIGYFMLTGQPLFSPRPSVAMVYAHVNEAPDRIAQRVLDLPRPEGLDALIESCVAKDPAARPNAAELVTGFERMIDVASSVARAKRPPRLFAGSGTSDLEQAVTAQIRQIIIELASVCELPMDEIDQLQNELSELELDLAMLSSEIRVELDAPADRHQQQVASTVAELQRRLASAFRTLTDQVLAARPGAPEDAVQLFEELDGLFERYRTL